jgi:hypothetical protein
MNMIADQHVRAYDHKVIKEDCIKRARSYVNWASHARTVWKNKSQSAVFLKLAAQWRENYVVWYQ